MTVPVEFTDITGITPEQFYPTPAKHSLPNWYAELKPYHAEPRDQNQTAKRCVPILDSFTAGYILYTPTDIEVGRDDAGKISYRWPHRVPVEFQALWQLGNHAKVTEDYDAIPKMPNPWGIKTPPGYSCLYVPPLNRDDAIFEIFAGVIDTDKYNQNGSFPFLFTDPSFTGLIPAGTPMAQVIPFRRESYEMRIGSDREHAEKQFHKMVMVFMNGYRKMFWSPKSYK